MRQSSNRANNIFTYILVCLCIAIIISLLFALFFFVQSSSIFIINSQLNFEVLSLELKKAIPYLLFSITIVSIIVLLLIKFIKVRTIKAFKC